MWKEKCQVFVDNFVSSSNLIMKYFLIIEKLNHSNIKENHVIFTFLESTDMRIVAGTAGTPEEPP